MTVDPRVHALRTLAQFLTRHGPVPPVDIEHPSPCAPSDEQGAPCEGLGQYTPDPLDHRPGGDEDEPPLALTA